MTPQPTDHLWWLVSRSAGIVALILISTSVLIGLAMASKLFRRPGIPAVLNALHEQLAVAGLIAIGVHGVALLGDPFIRPRLAGISVPFAIDYRSAFVAAGIVGGYLAAVLGLSYYARRRFGSKRWRNAHRFIVIAWMLSVVHVLGAGTDAAIPAVRWAVLAPILPAVVLGLARFLPRRGGSATKPRQAPHRDPAPSAGSVSPGGI